MKTLPLAEAKAKLSGLVDEVARRDERVMITKHGRPKAVLVSSDDMASLEATLEIMSDPEFYREILDARAALDRSEGRTYYDLEELFGEEVPARATSPRRRASGRRGRPATPAPRDEAQGARGGRRPAKRSRRR